MSEKPRFIPLKREYYESFVSGEKTEEFRPYGPRWNEQNCQIGRPVTLSLGYGKQNRTNGVITSFRVSKDPCKTEAWKNCYGPQVVDVACIGITVVSEMEKENE